MSRLLCRLSYSAMGRRGRLDKTTRSGVSLRHLRLSTGPTLLATGKSPVFQAASTLRQPVAHSFSTGGVNQSVDMGISQTGPYPGLLSVFSRARRREACGMTGVAVEAQAALAVNLCKTYGAGQRRSVTEPCCPFSGYRALMGGWVLARTSSSSTPGASSTRSRPPAVTSRTHRSVMIRWTTPLPVKGSEHSSTIL